MVTKVGESSNYFDLARIFVIQMGNYRVCCSVAESKV